MARQTKAQQTERQQAIEQLREWLKPGDTVYTILDHVSSSGMSRAIRVLIPTIGGPSIESVPPGGQPTDYVRKDGISVDFIHPNWAVGKALDLRHWKRNGREQDALVVGGCGMDMGFHLVNSLSQVLYGGRYRKLAEGEVWTPEVSYSDRPPAGYAWEGGYLCLGKGKCPSNYHVNHRDHIRCEGTRVFNPDGPDHGSFCYRPDAYNGRREVPEDWPRKTIDIGEGQTVNAGYLACIEYKAGEIPAGTKDLIMREDGSALQVCPTCKGEGQVPNPDGPERWDLVHTDGYALRHRWL